MGNTFRYFGSIAHVIVSSKSYFINPYLIFLVTNILGCFHPVSAASLRLVKGAVCRGNNRFTFSAVFRTICNPNTYGQLKRFPCHYFIKFDCSHILADFFCLLYGGHHVRCWQYNGKRLPTVSGYSVRLPECV